MNKNRIVLIYCSIVIITIFSYFIFSYSKNTISDKIIARQIFHRGNYDEPDTLDPQKAYSVPDYNILQDMYEGLMTYDHDGKVIFGQAKSFTVSDDKKLYVFKLKNNLKWSNGEPLTAFDFEYGIKRAFNPATGTLNTALLEPIKNSDLVLSGKLNINQLGIKALDKDTLQIELEYPVPFLTNLLTHNLYMPVYKTNIDKYQDEFTKPGIHVTNGPFKLSEWVVNSHLKLVKNDYYIKSDTVKLKGVIFYPINNPSVELSRYRSGDLDYTSKVPIDSLKWLKSRFKDELYTKPMLAAYYYVFNVTKPPFKDNKFLRQALSLAIDKQVIAEKILRGDRTAIDRFVPLGIDNYINYDNSNNSNNSKSNSVNNIASNKNNDYQLAKQLYNKAGYSKQKPLKVKLLYHTNESNKVIATAIASMWKNVLGVDTELINQEWKVFLKTRMEREDTQVLREGWIASYNDPMAFLELFLSTNPQNSSGYSNNKYDSLLDMARNESDIRKRTEYLFEAENMLMEDAPLVPIYSPRSYHLVKPYVEGVGISIFDSTLSRYIQLKS